MKIQICSDLHLEFPRNRSWIEQNPLIPTGEILIVAGDTQDLNRDFAELAFIQWASDHFESVYLIPGNHEYYGGYDASSARQAFNTKIMSNVFLVNNQTIEFDTFKLICATMWSHIQQYPQVVAQHLTDFHRIRFEGRRLSIENYNAMHRYAFDYLRQEIQKPGKKVVVTHHLPSNFCNAPEFHNSLLNEAFCVDHTQFISNHEIDYWIYGHSHRNLDDFKIGNTTMRTNQLGYVHMGEHGTFARDKVFTI